MAHPRVASFTPRHQNYHQEMANHTAQYAPHRHRKPIEIPSSSSSSNNPLPADAAWSNFYSSRHFSPRTASQSLPSDPSDNLETPTSSTLGFDTNTFSNYQPELGVSMPDGQQSTSFDPAAVWRQPEGQQYPNQYRPQTYEPRSTSLSSPYTLPDWTPGLKPYARQSMSHQPDFSAVPIPSFLPTPSHLDPGQPTMASSYSYGYTTSSCSRTEGANSLGLSFAPNAMPDRNGDQQRQRSYQDGAFNFDQFRGPSRQLAYAMPNTSAFRHNHSLSPPLSPIGANYVYEHGLMRVLSNDAPDMYNPVQPLSGAGPPSAILPAVSAPDMTHSCPQSPAGQSPTPPTPFAPHSPYSMSPTYDPQPNYSFRNYAQDLGQGGEPASRAHKSPAKGKKGRKRFASKPGDYSAEWESVTDKKERRRTQNRLAQRAFRARTRDQAGHGTASGSAK